MNPLPHISLPTDPLLLVASFVNVLSVTILIFAIFIDFLLYHKTAATKKKTHSLVETGSMFGYFFVYCLILTQKNSILSEINPLLSTCLIVSGTMLIAVGCAVNVWGRFALKDNWANQVTIYQQHSLVTHGAYRLARHPLYASIIWMLLGGSLVYHHIYALLSVIFIFIPMMIFRARQEEKLLMIEFDEYKSYQKRVGMFYPKIRSHAKI